MFLAAPVDRFRDCEHLWPVTRPLLIALLLTAQLGPAAFAGGPPVARFQSVLGDFEVLLDPAAAPVSVTNFAAYANRGDYDNTIIHRSTTYNPADIQIVQGGGFAVTTNGIVPVPTDPPISLEAGLPNSRGTLAMARTRDPDSATSQWYFNVADNPGLDFNYAVLGRVLGRGVGVIDAMGNLTAYRATTEDGLIFEELPLIGGENLVLINAVRVEPFAITNFTRSANTVNLRWAALSTNTPVRVERTTNLAAPWTVLVTNLTAGVFADTNAPSNSAFYRVVAE